MRGIAASALALATAGLTVQPASAADDQRHFDGAVKEISMCFARAAHKAHPDLMLDLSVSAPPTVAAKKYQSDLDNVWAAEFHDAAGGTDVVLQQGTGSASDLDEVWKLVERCG
jgi:hypothetical protein